MKSFKNFKKVKSTLIFKKKFNESYFLLYNQEKKSKNNNLYYTTSLIFIILSFFIFTLVLLKILIYFLDKDLFDILIDNWDSIKMYNLRYNSNSNPLPNSKVLIKIEILNFFGVS